MIGSPLPCAAHLIAPLPTTSRIETEYDLLLTNRLVLQPLAELDVYATDPEHDIGAGFGSLAAGVRV